MKPTPAKPRSSIAHVEGSGTAEETLTLSKPVYSEVYDESARNSMVVEPPVAMKLSVSVAQVLLLEGAKVNSCDEPAALAVRAAKPVVKLFHCREDPRSKVSTYACPGVVTIVCWSPPYGLLLVCPVRSIAYMLPFRGLEAMPEWLLSDENQNSLLPTTVQPGGGVAKAL